MALVKGRQKLKRYLLVKEQLLQVSGLLLPGMWKRSYFNGSGSTKSMPLPLPHHSKKHTVNNLLDIILFNLSDIILPR